MGTTPDERNEQTAEVRPSDQQTGELIEIMIRCLPCLWECDRTVSRLEGPSGPLRYEQDSHAE